LIAKPPYWQRSALAAAAAALFGFGSPSAWSLSLGPIVVQSALGEPLRAEIDVPEINSEEAASLKAAIASPEAFRAAGMEYNNALATLRTTLLRRANGSAFIRLTSDRPVNEPFVDMILEASWASGRIVRDYTMLFDPPNLRAQATPTATPAQVTAPSVQAAPAPAGVRPTPSAQTRPPAVAAKSAAGVAPVPSKMVSAGDKQVTVKPGDTASRIASNVKPDNVSLDQMLVALLRANPGAFINNNINRVKSGAVLAVPTAEQAQSVAPNEARQIVVAQSRDFGDFRRKLASNAPTAQVAAADRQASGSVQTQVQDKKAGAATPDKLTLSKGAVQAQAGVDKLTAERAAKDAAARAAEVSKNIQELNKLGAASGKPAAPAVVAAVTALPAAPAASAAPALPPVSAPVAVVKPAAPKPVVAPLPVAEPSLIDQLTENPLVPAAGVGLVALLAGFGFYRSRQRKQASEVDSAYLESRLQPDSFFGASGGQRVDTADSVVGGSSMVYTPSQLDAADDVDPIAEADVYLAYGRDIQAEEILKEALKFNPSRVAIHQKLLEIYAKRRDTKSFETAASEAHKVTGGDGPDWHRICDLGLSIDPGNALYMPGGKPSTAYGTSEATQPMPMQAAIAPGNAANSGGIAAAGLAAAGLATAGLAATSFATSATPVTLPPATPAPVELDFDLDLDFSLDEENANVAQNKASTEQTAKLPAADSGPAPLDMNFELPISGMGALPSLPPASGHGPLEFSLPSSSVPLGADLIAPMSAGEPEDFRQQAAVSFGTTIPAHLATTLGATTPIGPPNNGMMEFDMSALSLDLGNAADRPVAAAPAPTEDPLATKLLLAEEFSSIGDDDGARSLIEEVILEASGEMKTRAQQALAKLG
jgi:pilus assembly protein FimV